MLHPQHVILAAVFNNAEWIAPVIFILVMVLRIIGAAVGGNNPNAANRRPAGPRPPVPPQGQANGNDALKGEIDEFLRRVSNRREGQPQRRPAGTPPRPIQVVRPPQSPLAPQSPNPPDRRRRPVPVIVARAGVPVVKEAVIAPRSGDEIDDHVKKFLNIGQFEQRADHLASIDQQERKFDQQIQQTFAHEVGHLKPSALSSATDERSVSQTAPQVVDEKSQNISFALLTGSNLINAVIVSEIMQRPEFRW